MSGKLCLIAWSVDAKVVCRASKATINSCESYILYIFCIFSYDVWIVWCMNSLWYLCAWKIKDKRSCFYSMNFAFTMSNPCVWRKRRKCAIIGKHENEMGNGNFGQWAITWQDTLWSTNIYDKINSISVNIYERCFGLASWHWLSILYEKNRHYWILSKKWHWFAIPDYYNMYLGRLGELR